MNLSSADHSVTPPRIYIPRKYNAAHDLLERNLIAGRDNKIAYIDDHGSFSFRELQQKCNKVSNLLSQLGIRPEERLLLALKDTIDFPSVFLGAIKAGIVPIPVNTMLTSDNYKFMIQDSRARALVVSQEIFPFFQPILKDNKYLQHIIISGKKQEPYLHLQTLMKSSEDKFQVEETTSDDTCFWLYSSGSTGTPKGTLHIHSSLIKTAELYAKPILGITDNDTVFSAAKLFFAYGLGNALTFPLSVGATTILMSGRPTPEAVFKKLVENKPTIFYGVPTLYGALLSAEIHPEKSTLALRICTSAGEPLPPELGERWKERFDVDILDGIGSTEMLHIFLSNRPSDVNYGTTGKPVPGYELSLVDNNKEVSTGELGDLKINGPTAAIKYWNNTKKSRNTFAGKWTISGDKYSINSEGYYVYGGRSDDMLKVSGQYVSPFEVEAALISHEAVFEAAVVGAMDKDGLTKPKAYVVLLPNYENFNLEKPLQEHVKSKLARFKYPRWIEFVKELPKTATGKIQRFKLRD